MIVRGMATGMFRSLIPLTTIPLTACRFFAASEDSGVLQSALARLASVAFAAFPGQLPGNAFDDGCNYW
jgi:hypothetical protein